MKCPSCHAELAGEPKYCSECGSSIQPGAPVQSSITGSRFVSPQDSMAGGERAWKPPAGFSRTLSTELVARQMEMRAVVKLGTLVQNRTYQPGEVLMHKGETHRDLFILTHGLVEISRQEGEADFVLNEIEPPYILGEIAFLFGTPRTATATATTEVKAFILRYEEFKELAKDLPAWLPPLLTSLASDMKSLHHKVKIAEKKIFELEKQSRPRT
jgi:CRP/FNR family cyclic AMP-dependent transcriptional regulator